MLSKNPRAEQDPHQPLQGMKELDLPIRDVGLLKIDLTFRSGWGGLFHVMGSVLLQSRKETQAVPCNLFLPELESKSGFIELFEYRPHANMYPPCNTHPSLPHSLHCTCAHLEAPKKRIKEKPP